MPELENFANTPNWIKENLCEGNFKILKSRPNIRLHLRTINSIFIFNIYRLIQLELPRIDNYKWIEKSNLKSAALPSPIRKILNSLEGV